jgi:uncharacterized protein YwgA
MNSYEVSKYVTATINSIVETAAPLEGRVRLQKTIYLLKRLGLRPLARVRYTYHHYGPYSETVSDALRSAVHSGLILEEKESFEDEWQRFRYSVERSHPDYDYVKLDSADQARVQEVAALTQKEHWRTLELAATVLFLEHKNGLDRQRAITRAIELKPACTSKQRDAEQLLDTLEL